MTVLHLDQPRQLRLVTSSDQPRGDMQRGDLQHGGSQHGSSQERRGSRRQRTSQSRYRRAAQLNNESRRLLHDVLCARLAAGKPINADAVRVILAARQTHHVGSVSRITSELLWQLVFVDILAWCRNRRLEVPDHIPAALTAIVMQLHTTGQLDSSSDPIGELLHAIDECVGTDSREREPAAAAPLVGSIRSRRGHSRKQSSDDV